VLAAACGGGGDSEVTDVASIDDLEDAGSSADDDSAAAASSEDIPSEEVDVAEAFLAFSECMRAEGVDFPDPAFDSDGGLDLSSMRDIDRNQDGFDEALQVCQSELEGAALGRGRGEDFRATLEEGMLGLTECLRDEGVQVDDFDFDNFGAGGQGAGAGQGGAGQGGGADDGGGAGVERGNADPGARIAGALGLDMEDPAVEAAMEICQPILTDIIGDGPAAAGGS
jgi:hypothetical protein